MAKGGTQERRRPASTAVASAGTAVASGATAVALGLVVAVSLLAGGCGTSSDAATTVYVAAGQLPPAERPTAGGSGANGAGSVSNTIPLAKEDPETALFSALGTFQACLSGMGVVFVGAPDPSNPGSPANDPDYLKNLTTCAAKTNILQALQDANKASDNLTAAQVKSQNQMYLRWRKCMIARGWKVAEPKPNDKGLLFTFDASSAADFTPPPGESLLSSSDLSDCAAKAQQGSS